MVFKRNWEVSSAQEAITQSIIDQVTKKVGASQYQVLQQGCANYNIRVHLPQHEALLRIYCRDKEVQRLEESIQDLVADTLPVAHVLSHGEEGGYAYSLHSLCQGIQLRDVIAEPQEDLRKVMYDLGDSIGKMQSWRFEKPGRLDEHLQIVEPMNLYHDSLHRLAALQKEGKLPADECSSWQDLLSDMQSLFPSQQLAHLVHGDYDPSNILVEKRHGQWELSAILDWEFAQAGSYYRDMANMLRYEYSFSKEYKYYFVDGISHHIRLPTDWQKTITLCNIYGLFDCLANRVNIPSQPNRYADITQLLRRFYKQLTYTKYS